MQSDIINDLAALEQLYGKPAAPSIFKEVSYIHPVYRPFIEAAPFAALSTVGPDGMDVSPRGDPPGFIHIEDEKTLLLPDRRGNNRIDSLRNILHDNRVALLLLIPVSAKRCGLTAVRRLLWRKRCCSASPTAICCRVRCCAFM
ncbi:pyridoxamine 5'-phosphate oxidase, FMN-binding family [Serratia plymuthica]|uniref:Pyridoxamine 5'-phosphate oxidase, FMN-binding family n=1 Tax=Serratia plymuthica TaxID=82996 RepID=A0A2X4UXE0_SERPL|nr:pyridoxamine 5'-phosphate oxidase, FMN-binding family [Serratia plymuthica]